MAAATIPPSFERFLARERRAGRFTTPLEPPAAGSAVDRLFVGAEDASRLSVDAARRAAGLFRPTQRSEAVWVDGENELAVGIGSVRLQTDHGIVVVTVPVRCDQTGPAEVHVAFAVGQDGRPAGLYASTQRRPRGPALVVDTWGEALVAFAWQVLLGLVSGLAGATGKDSRGNVLVPAELAASPEGLAIVPMARHRFSGSPGLVVRTSAT